MGNRLQFGRVGYLSNVNRMSVQYAGGAKNKPADFSCSKLVDMEAMQAYLDEQNEALTEEMNQKFGGIFESVRYSVIAYPDELMPRLQMVANSVLSKDMKAQCEEHLEGYQKRFAKAFNKQAFTQTEYGFAKFPSTNRFGVDLLHDDKLVPGQRLSVAGGENDKYTEIIAAPSLTGGCNYYFKYDKDKWPEVQKSLYYTKDGTMRESTDPVMAGVKAVLENQGRLDSVDAITVYDDQCVVVTMPQADDEAILSIADGIADYGMNAKMEQDGKELEAALSVLEKNGMEIK